MPVFPLPPTPRGLIGMQTWRGIQIVTERQILGCAPSERTTGIPQAAVRPIRGNDPL